MNDARAGDPPAVRIELENERAWCGARLLDLTPKAFAVLRHFVEHPERVVTKDDLLAAVWGDTVVSEAALTSCIRDLRRALADTSRAPRYIETVHRRGFRFIGPVAPSRRVPTAPRKEVDRFPTLVGRDAELARLHALFGTAINGRRQLVFVTGEAGIGKTTLVEAFLTRLDPGDGLRIGRGQCVEQYGTGEAYLPVLEALARMAREPGGDAIVHALRQHAPTWLAQLPGVLTDEDLEAVQRRAQGTTRDRMLRELNEALDVVSFDVPLVLVLEDLHWSDSATVDLLAMLARRRDPARFLILATVVKPSAPGASICVKAPFFSTKPCVLPSGSSNSPTIPCVLFPSAYVRTAPGTSIWVKAYCAVAGPGALTSQSSPRATPTSVFRVTVARCRCCIVFFIVHLSSSPGINPGCGCTARSPSSRAGIGAFRCRLLVRHARRRYCDTRLESWENSGITEGKPRGSSD